MAEMTPEHSTKCKTGVAVQSKNIKMEEHIEYQMKARFKGSIFRICLTRIRKNCKTKRTASAMKYF